MKITSLKGTRKPKKAASRSGASSSSKRDPKAKDVGGAHAHNDSNDDEATWKTRLSQYRRDYRFIGPGQSTDSDDDYIWQWDHPASPSTGYPVLKRMRRRTTEEIAGRDRKIAMGDWVTAKKRRPDNTQDAEESRGEIFFTCELVHE